jgi:hypothetical protein
MAMSKKLAGTCGEDRDAGIARSALTTRVKSRLPAKFPCEISSRQPNAKIGRSPLALNVAARPGPDISRRSSSSRTASSHPEVLWPTGARHAQRHVLPACRRPRARGRSRESDREEAREEVDPGVGLERRRGGRPAAGRAPAHRRRGLDGGLAGRDPRAHQETGLDDLLRGDPSQ